MISPGLFFGSPLLITWQQSFAYGRRIKEGFVDVSLQLLQSECNNKTRISPMSKGRQWECSDTIWTLNVYLTMRDNSDLAGRLCLKRQFQLSLRLAESFQTLRFWNKSMTNYRSEVCRHIIQYLILWRKSTWKLRASLSLLQGHSLNKTCLISWQIQSSLTLFTYCSFFPCVSEEILFPGFWKLG